MNMTDQDWERWLAEWRESFRQSTPVAHEQDNQDSVDHNYAYEVGRGTPKARFFCTEDIDGEVYGFWAPKSVIVSVTDRVVKLPSWFNKTIIKYNR